MYDDDDEGLDQMIGGVNMANGDNESAVALSDGLGSVNLKETGEIMEFVEALEMANNLGRFRATLRHDDPPMAPMPLCDCEDGHASKREALDCPKAIKNMPVGLQG